MKRIHLHMLLPAVLLGLVVPASADVPRKKPVGSYSKLWSQSPFTVPPPPPDPGEEGPGALDDYVLTGVSKLPEGYFVSLMNKKKREDRITIIPGQPNAGGYKVMSVVQDPIDYKATKVKISIGGMSGETGTVTYDEKYLALKRAPVAAKKPTGKPGTPQVPRPGTPAKPTAKPTTPSSSSPNRTPRVRRVPTPPKR